MVSGKQDIFYFPYYYSQRVTYEKKKIYDFCIICVFTTNHSIFTVTIFIVINQFITLLFLFKLIYQINSIK